MAPPRVLACTLQRPAALNSHRVHNRPPSTTGPFIWLLQCYFVYGVIDADIRTYLASWTAIAVARRCWHAQPQVDPAPRVMRAHRLQERQRAAFHSANICIPGRPVPDARSGSSHTCWRVRAIQYDETVVGSKAALNGTCLKLFYRTGWESAKVHGSLLGGSWQDYPLQKVTSAPGCWLMGVITAPQAPSSRASTAGGSSTSSDGGSSSSTPPFLEFVVTDGEQWDKPLGGGNFLIDSPGVYSLRGGEVTRVTGPAVMIVSDLDGTMVGDDTATAAFRHWWEDCGVLRGGLLVYNTGRSLSSFQQLLSDKAGCLAHPEVLISAVGTKIYNWDGRGWQEDAGWARALDVGWRVDVVREAAYAALAKVGKERMHFRPPEEQNQHKVTCGVHTSVLPEVLDDLERDLARGRVSANIITSGAGEWRFLDMVPKRAGKLEALEHVRKSHGFPLESTVACGDSGNDILMLSGRNLAIVVGNAQPDLKQWVTQHQAADESPLPGKQRLLTTQQHEALGILEGLAYFGLK